MFYAFVEKVEALGRLRYVRLEAFPARQWLGLQRAGSLGEYAEPLLARVLEFVATSAEIRRLTVGQPLREDAWHVAHLSNSDGIAANEYAAPLSAEAVSEPTRIAALPRVDAREGRALSRTFLLRPEGEIDKVGMLRPSAMVVCASVGQGNCVALCGEDSVPIAYFDVGAGCYRNAHTRPSQLGVCLANEAPVVLSHWDADHWYGAVLEPRLVARTWLTPSQRIGPAAAELTRRIRSNGNLIVWPAGAAELNAAGVVVRCSGRGRNNSGLAWIVWPVGSDGKVERFVLLPGDCDYRRIPSELLRNLSAVVAAHHGAHVASIADLQPGGRAQVCYSYGAGNSYVHPHGRAVERYHVGGWHRRFDTPLGNVALAYTGATAPRHSCGDPNCGFGIAQW